MIRLSYELMSATLPDLQIKTALSFLQAHSTSNDILLSIQHESDFDLYPAGTLLELWLNYIMYCNSPELSVDTFGESTVFVQYL